MPHARRTSPAASSSSSRASTASAASSPSRSYQARIRRERSRRRRPAPAAAPRGSAARAGRRCGSCPKARWNSTDRPSSATLLHAFLGIGDVDGRRPSPAPRGSARHLQRGVAGETAHPRLQTANIIGIGLSGLRIDAGRRATAAQQHLDLLAASAAGPAAAPRRACRGRRGCRRARYTCRPACGAGHRNLAIEHRAGGLGERRAGSSPPSRPPPRRARARCAGSERRRCAPACSCRQCRSWKFRYTPAL